MFFQTYAGWLCTNLWNFSNTLRRAFQQIADASEMAKRFQVEPEVKDHPHAAPLTVTKGAISFDHVRFSYDCRRINDGAQDGKEECGGCIGDLTLDIPAGKTIALVGKSGAGKSTIACLLGRYHDVQAGSICIDGQNIAMVTQQSLRHAIAVVPQQPELFHRSLLENIRYAKPEATMEQVIAAAKRAHAWEFMERLPKRLETIVGERGMKLSGGERQRIALARAFLADAPILILDEATSALDSETEHLIQAAIADLLHNRTCIVIAHRLSTISKAHSIVVLEQGAIVEQGTHADLLQKKGRYFTLWTHQTGDYLR